MHTIVRQEQSPFIIAQQVRSHRQLLARAVNIPSFSEEIIGNTFGSQHHVYLSESAIPIYRPVLLTPFCEFKPEVSSLALLQVPCTTDEQFS